MSEQGACNPTISIALCTYNGALYLREQLDSLLAQSRRDFEIVAVDDGSTDETVTILQEYANRDRRLRVIVNSVNLGFRKNFERSISLCTGQFIALCDQDDIWLPEKLRVLSDVIGDAPMAFCDSALIDADGRPLNVNMSGWWSMQSTCDPVPFVFENFVSGHAVLFSRELLQYALPIPSDFFHDHWLATIAAAHGGVVFCPLQLVLYRQHGSNVTSLLKSRRPHRSLAGRGHKKHQAVARRLEQLSLAWDDESKFLHRWSDLWNRHTRSWLSPRLTWFMASHRQRILAFRKESDVDRLVKAASYLFGLRMRRLFRPKKYTP
jgi:glycosyltransferase involved in cell wall biosynthesis